MDFFFRKELSQNEILEAEKFYYSLENVTIEQHPSWSQLLGTDSPPRFFFSREKSQINCFAVITEKKYLFFKTASITFGPLFKDAEALIVSIKAIREFYKTRGYFYLSIQLGISSGNVSEYIEYNLNKFFKIRYVFDRNNWSSLAIYLDESLEEIIKKFSKGHKSAIKKSAAEGVKARKLISSKEIEAFSNIYMKMNLARGLEGSKHVDTNFLIKINAFLEKNNLGFFLGVFDQTDVMAGGIVVIYQGNTARYYKGASDPERKNIAVLHTAIVEAISISKSAGYKVFDLWGYNHMVDENDQVYYINRFKKGFSSNYLFYPKIMHISLKPWGYHLYKRLIDNQKRLKFLSFLLKRKQTE